MCRFIFIFLLRAFKGLLSSGQIVPVASASQHTLVDLVCALSTLQTDSVLQLVKEVVKRPLQIKGDEVSSSWGTSGQGALPEARTCDPEASAGFLGCDCHCAVAVACGVVLLEMGASRGKLACPLPPHTPPGAQFLAPSAHYGTVFREECAQMSQGRREVTVEQAGGVHVWGQAIWTCSPVLMELGPDPPTEPEKHRSGSPVLLLGKAHMSPRRTFPSCRRHTLSDSGCIESPPLLGGRDPGKPCEELCGDRQGKQRVLAAALSFPFRHLSDAHVSRVGEAIRGRHWC